MQLRAFGLLRSSGGRRLRRAQGNQDRKAGSAPDDRPELDRMPQQCSQALHDRQTQPEALRGRRGDLSKLAKNQGGLVAGDSGSGVADINPNLVAPASQTDNHSAFGSISHGIGNEVEDQSLK